MLRAGVFVALIFAVGLVAFRVLPGETASAVAGPCDPVSPSVSAIEVELLSQVNAWRATNLGAPAMTLSGPANAAAQWFAEAMIAGKTSGHVDQYGRIWQDRLVDCGFPGRFGSGEGLAGFGSSSPLFGATPAEAIALMVATPNHQNAVNAPVAWACAGVGYAVNPSPSPGQLRYAWVVIGVQTFSPCPPDVVIPPPPPPSPTRTNTPSPTPTATPSPTPTATPTPLPTVGIRNAVPLVVRDGDTR